MKPCKISILLILQLITLNLSAADSKNFQVKQIFDMSLEELLNVKVITAGKTPQTVSDIPASSVIVTRKDIETYGYTTLNEILKDIPGLYSINDYAEDGVKFGVRGFWSGVANDNIIILVNNIPQTKNVFSNHPLVQIPVPVEAIDRIEVVRGPMSVIYGSGAFYGAINIITNESWENEPETIASIGLGSSNSKKGFLRTSNNTGSTIYTVNVSTNSTDGIDQPADKLMSDTSMLSGWGISTDYSTGGSLKENNNYLDISGQSNSLYYNLVLIESTRGCQFSFPAYGKGHLNNYFDYNFAVGYNKKYTEAFSINTKFTYYKDRLWFKLKFLNDDFFGIQQIESKAWDYTLDTFYNPVSSLKITTGIEIKDIFDIYNLYDLPSFHDPFFENSFIKVPDDHSITSLAGYSQFEYKPLSNIQFVGGLRLEKSLKYQIKANFSNETELFNKKQGTVNREKIEFIPRLAVIYKYNTNHVWKLLYGKAINRPSFFQDYLQIQAGDKNLLPEKIETFELNYQSVIKPNLLISFSFFHNILDNLITRIILLDEIGNYDSSYFSNSGRLISDGVEFSISTNPTKKLYVQLSGSLQKTKDKQLGHEDIVVAYSPQKLGYLKTRYQINKHLTTALSGQYVSSMESFWDDTPDVRKSIYSPIGRIGQKSDDFMLIGANIRYNNFMDKGYFVNFRISNILNSDIRYPTFNNNTWADKGTLDYGREFLISFGRKF